MVNAMMIQLYQPLNFMGMVYREIKQAIIDIEKMFGVLLRDPEIKDSPGAGPLVITSGHVRFEDVRFSYDPDRPILKGLSFEVPAGKTVAIVGPSGAGKSTISRLLFRLYDVSGGKILIDATVPLVPPKVARVQLPSEGSAVAAIQRELGASVRVVSAFQNVSAHHLKDLSHPVDCDVLVCGDDPAAREIVVDLAADIGLRGIHAGPIANSAPTEALTSILISITMRYKIQGAGIRITGLSATAGRAS